MIKGRRAKLLTRIMPGLVMQAKRLFSVPLDVFAQRYPGSPLNSRQRNARVTLGTITVTEDSSSICVRRRVRSGRQPQGWGGVRGAPERFILCYGGHPSRVRSSSRSHYFSGRVPSLGTHSYYLFRPSHRLDSRTTKLRLRRKQQAASGARSSCAYSCSSVYSTLCESDTPQVNASFSRIR